MSDPSSTVAAINAAVTGVAGPSDSSGRTAAPSDQDPPAGGGQVVRAAPSGDGGGGGSMPSDPALPYQQAIGVVTQSIAQSAAIAVSDAADSLRNIETVMTTAMGVAMANWLKQPGNILYEKILTAANKAIQDAAANFKTIGTDAAEVVEQFKL